MVEGLLKVADENKGAEIGEKALYGAFTAAREKRDLRQGARDRRKRLVDRVPEEPVHLGRAADPRPARGRGGALRRGRRRGSSRWAQQLGRDATGARRLAGRRARCGWRWATTRTREQGPRGGGRASAARARREVLVLLAQAQLKAKRATPRRATRRRAGAQARQDQRAGRAPMLAEVDAATDAERSPTR